MDNIKKSCIKTYSSMLAVLLSCAISVLPAQAALTKQPLYFYGAVSPSGDPETIRLTQDLFYSQITALELFKIYDQRQTVYSADVLQNHKKGGDLIFYAEIYEKDGNWISTLHIIDAAAGKEAVNEKQYDGYYKILMEAKGSLSTLVKQLNFSDMHPTSNPANTQDASQTLTRGISAEALSGTWQGETHIDKIVILRGGRGFVIFKNGASMNISVSVDGSQVTARQEGKSNASFFPELPREVALLNAVKADPIYWELTIENENSLSGTKHTLVAEYDSARNITVMIGRIPVRWFR